MEAQSNHQGTSPQTRQLGSVPVVGRPGPSTGSSAADARVANLTLVLQTLYQEPGLTRADLARRTGLTRVTISDLVAQLIDDGLVCETGIAEQTRPGKKAVSLAVRDDTTDIIACDLSGSEVLRGGVYSLFGELRREVTRPIDGARGEDAIAVVVDLIADLVQGRSNRLLGIGVGMPGTVDAAGRVITAIALGWSNLDLQARLAQHFDVPIFVINDANAGALAEQTFANGTQDMLRLQITRGVGAGLLLGGQVVIGQSAAAGEIGHVQVEDDGIVCQCGQRGCLETWASVTALRKRIDATPDQQEAILAEGGRRLGLALVPILAMLDVGDVVLGGESELIGGTFTNAAQAFIDERLQPRITHPVVLRTSTLGGDATLLGVVALVLRASLGLYSGKGTTTTE